MITGTGGLFISGYNDLDVGNVTTYPVNTNLAPNTTYYYRVRAKSNNSVSANSNTINVTTFNPANGDYFSNGNVEHLSSNQLAVFKWQHCRKCHDASGFDK